MNYDCEQSCRCCGQVYWTWSYNPKTPRTKCAECRGSHAHPLYNTWLQMRRRCADESCEWYGGRGIGVCEAWESFPQFALDVGKRPEGMTLDRIDPDGNYEPNNVRWATAEQQAHNRRPRKDARP